MNKKVKTVLIAALSIFGAGLLILLCVSASIGFDYSKLTFGSGSAGGSGEDGYKQEHIDKDIEDRGQDVYLDLISADVSVEPSDDGRIHLSYDNTEQTSYKLAESRGVIELTQNQRQSTLFGITWTGELQRSKVVLSLPSGRKGGLDVSSTSGKISVSELDISGDMNISGVSGDIIVTQCKSKSLGAGSASGGINLSFVDSDSIGASTVSGDISISDIDGGVPLILESVSGKVYAENVVTEDMSVSNISGRVEITDVSGQKADISTTSGGAYLSRADFEEISFSSVSGDIRGTVAGSSEDYAVFTDTVSGYDSLSGHRGRGERTLDLSSTSGSFDIGFAG